MRVSTFLSIFFILSVKIVCVYLNHTFASFAQHLRLLVFLTRVVVTC